MGKDLTNIKGCIYKLTAPNGKIYIGQTINERQRKYHYNSGDFKQQVKLWNSSRKYNWNPSKTFEIIEECLCGPDKKYLNEREIYWIREFDSLKNGLNCNEGGHGNIGHKHSKETLKKMSDALKGIKHPKWRNKQKSEYTKGRNHTKSAKKKMSRTRLKNMNDVTKDKISKGLMGNKNGVGNKGNAKKIICLNNGKIYESIKKASIELSLHSANIINVCKDVYKQTGGYKFKYLIETK